MPRSKHYPISTDIIAVEEVVKALASVFADRTILLRDYCQLFKDCMGFDKYADFKHNVINCEVISNIHERVQEVLDVFVANKDAASYTINAEASNVYPSLHIGVDPKE